VLLLNDLALPLVLHARCLVKGCVVVLVRSSQGAQLLICEVRVLAGLQGSDRDATQTMNELNELRGLVSSHLAPDKIKEGDV
jgi:hypothetical protein